MVEQVSFSLYSVDLPDYLLLSRTLFKNENGREGGAINDDNGSWNAANSSAPVNGLAKMRAQMAARASASKRPEPMPIPTPPQSSVTPDPEPPTARPIPTPGPEPIPTAAPVALEKAPNPPKSPAPSELTSDDAPSDDGSHHSKKKKSKRSTGKAKRRVVEDSDEDEELPAAKPTKGRGRPKRAPRKK